MKGYKTFFSLQILVELILILINKVLTLFHNTFSNVLTLFKLILIGYLLK